MFCPGRIATQLLTELLAARLARILILGARQKRAFFN